MSFFRFSNTNNITTLITLEFKAILPNVVNDYSLGVHDNNSLEEQSAQIESLLLYGEFQQSPWMFVYKISAPPKEFPSINGN